jgi:uncharacterized membrane protein YfcA
MIAAIPIDLVLVCLLLGAAVGIMAGLLGVGGGLIIVPALLFLFAAHDFPASMAMHMAVGTSLASILFTSVSSAAAHHRRGSVLWTTTLSLSPGIVAGAALGGFIADLMSGTALRAVFAAFEFLAAWQLWRAYTPPPGRVLPGLAGLFLAGVVIGTVSTIIGIGGGALTVPFLVWCNVDMRKAVATSAAGGFPIAVAGTAAFIVAGLDEAALPPGATGYVYWPAAAAIGAVSILSAPLGAALAHRLPMPTLRRVFAVFLAVLGVRTLL